MEGDNAVDEWPYLEDGYCQSKWVAEQMCREALSRTVPLRYYYPYHLSCATPISVAPLIVWLTQ